MNIQIKPQDKTPHEAREYKLHPDRIRRLKEFAQSLDNSDENYVLDQILDQVLPAEKKNRPATAPKVDKTDAPKEPRKVA